MAELDVKRALQHFLKRSLRLRVADRLLSYCLFNISVYLLLLIILVLFNASLVLVNLFFYCSLSLLPLFLIYGWDADLFSRTVRRIDEHCQVEAYLQTTSREHRSFMSKPVEAMLTRRMNERKFSFRFSRVNTFLTGLCFIFFVLLQVSSFARLHSLTPSLTAQNLKKRLSERLANLEAPAQPVSEKITGELSPDAEAWQGIAQGERAERRAGGEVEGADLEELPAGSSIQRQMPGFGREGGTEHEPPPPEGSDTYERMLVPLPKSNSILEELLQQGGRESEQIAEQASGAEAGSSGAGRAFKDSPLLEYQTAPERIAVEGNTTELSTAQNLAESRRRNYLNTVFPSFILQIRVVSDFDPLIDTIRGRYKELIVDRY